MFTMTFPSWAWGWGWAVAILAIILLGILVLPWFFFLLNLQTTLNRVSDRNRAMPAGHVWLNFIPVFNLGWFIYTVMKVRDSVRAEYQSRGWAAEGDFGYNVGLAAGILAIVSFFLGLVPVLGWGLAIAELVCSKRLTSRTGWATKACGAECQHPTGIRGQWLPRWAPGRHRIRPRLLGKRLLAPRQPRRPRLPRQLPRRPPLARPWGRPCRPLHLPPLHLPPLHLQALHLPPRRCRPTRLGRRRARRVCRLKSQPLGSAPAAVLPSTPGTGSAASVDYPCPGATDRPTGWDDREGRGSLSAGHIGRRRADRFTGPRSRGSTLRPLVGSESYRSGHPGGGEGSQEQVACHVTAPRSSRSPRAGPRGAGSQCIQQ